MSVINIIRAVLNMALSLLQYSVIIECIMSWIPEVTRYKAYDFLRSINGVFLDPIRRLLSRYTHGMPLDISPIVALFIIRVLHWILMQILQILRIFLI